MGHSRIRGFSLTSAIVIAAGFIAVQAAPDCARFVHSYVTVPVRNRVSKVTAEAWEKWRVGHPDWKPSPNVQRPKYKLTRKETMEKIEFACSLPTEPMRLDLLFSPADFNAPPPIIMFPPPPMEATQIAFPAPMPPAVSETPNEIAQTEWPPMIPYVPSIVEGGSPVFPVLPAIAPPGVAPVPEPPSLVLVALGLASISFVTAARSRRTDAHRA
jgi:hypothetical protein